MAQAHYFLSRKMKYALLTMMLLISLPQAFAQTWTAYQRISSSDGYHVDIASSKGTFEYSAGARQYSFRLYNPYNTAIKVIVKIRYETGSGEELFMRIYATIRPEDTQERAGDNAIAKKILTYTVEEFEFL